MQVKQLETSQKMWRKDFDLPREEREVRGRKYPPSATYGFLRIYMGGVKSLIFSYFRPQKYVVNLKKTTIM